MITKEQVKKLGIEIKEERSKDPLNEIKELYPPNQRR